MSSTEPGDLILNHEPYLEQDDVCGNGEGCEHDVVDWAHYGGVEQVQCLIQVVHLRDYACCHYLHAGGGCWLKPRVYFLGYTMLGTLLSTGAHIARRLAASSNSRLPLIR